MRILIVSTLFPPYIQGGAELCAFNLADWLTSQGHTVGVLTTSPNADVELDGQDVGGLLTWRKSMPRNYTAFEANYKSGLQKPVWHLQDHFDPRNKTIVANVIESFQPDLVNIHIIQGIGFNALTEIGRRNIPTVITLHDLSLACVKMAMFVDGKECQGQCTVCAMSAKTKMGYLRSIQRLGFISPSQANLDKVSALLPISKYQRAHILNANKYPVPTAARIKSETTRFLYVGRLHESKGIYVLIQALEALAKTYDFCLTLVGTGPSADDLRNRFGHYNWINFTGHVSMEEVANWMQQSDLLLVPSIWLENSPGVVIQALGLSLPVMGSNKGGIPELVIDGENGVLVSPGDVEAWRDALEVVLKDPSQLEHYRLNAASRSSEFDQDTLGNQVTEFFGKVMSSPGH